MDDEGKWELISWIFIYLPVVLFWILLPLSLERISTELRRQMNLCTLSVDFVGIFVTIWRDLSFVGVVRVLGIRTGV